MLSESSRSWTPDAKHLHVYVRRVYSKTRISAAEDHACLSGQLRESAEEAEQKLGGILLPAQRHANVSEEWP